MEKFLLKKQDLEFYTSRKTSIHKKYPTIVYIYERLSDGLNQFNMPDLFEGPINIPLVVSQGYLVFCPDIHYTLGKVEESIEKYVISGTREIMKQNYVDSTKIGVQGHSMGGYEVNDLITRTSIFSAAVSASGQSNLISSSGTPLGFDTDPHQYVAMSQTRIGATLWQDNKPYILNSPIFRANKVTTPLLLMHNENDGSVPFSQSVEYFTALRFLKKKVWLLQYENGGHYLIEKEDKR